MPHRHYVYNAIRICDISAHIGFDLEVTTVLSNLTSKTRTHLPATLGKKRPPIPSL